MSTKYEELRNVRKAELLADGIRLVGCFTLPERIASVNGQLCGVTSDGQFFPLDVQGRPIGSCGLCGYLPLHVHYTLKNKKTGELINVGSECLADLFGSKKGDYIKKAVQSINRKVSSDYRRPLKQADINAWLNALPTPTDARNKRVDGLVAKFPHYYYSLPNLVPSEYILEQHKKGVNWSTDSYAQSLGFANSDELKEAVFETVWSQIPHEKHNDRQALIRQDAVKFESRDRTFWDYQLSVFAQKDWNPENIKKEYETQAKKDGIAFQPIKWTPLTPEQRVEEHKLIDTAVNEWIAKVTRK